MTAPAQQPNPLQVQQQNDALRRFVVANSVKMEQQIFSQNVDISQQTTINIAANSIRFAGLLLGFIVEVSGNVTNGATTAANLTPHGTANLVKQFRFDDLSSYTRIQTSGRHLAMLNTVRQGFAYGGAYAPNLPIGYGNNFDVFEGPATLAASATGDLRQVYYMPVAYAPNDLRGSIYMATTGASMNLQIELNDTPFGATGANPLNLVYTGNAAGDWTNNVTVTVYQVYLDQIPRDPNSGQPILPGLDLDTVYDLKETTFVGVSAAQDFPMAYSNYRAFLSTILIYDNGGTFNAGSDVNYFSLASANFTNLFKYTPEIAALKARMAIMADFPDATYLFDSRDTPINTINFGNMELNINASVANAGARCVVGYEAFARIGQLKTASSLAGG
jgi:hypothetical protein